jgi:hypothetical protein
MKRVSPALHLAHGPRVNRRVVLKGLGGAALALPFLDAFRARSARAQETIPSDTYAIFFRQANGCAQANSNGELGDEPERFFPRDLGALTDASMADRAVDELAAHKDKLLVLRNVNLEYFDYGDGHAWGVLQALTARGPVVAQAGGDSEADGESLDHRIGAELNADGRESLVLYAGADGGWLNGPCMSYRASNTRRTAIQDPFQAYQQIVGGAGGLDPVAQEKIRRRVQSVNDLVRAQLTRLQAHPRLSALDRQRLDLHLASVRDLEVQLGCRMDAAEEAALEGAVPGNVNTTNGNEVLAIARLHMDVAALAVGCGYTRAVSIQVGQGNDGATRYQNLATGELMENYHYISHRRLSHDSSGSIISDGDVLHHYVDRQFAQTFNHLVTKLRDAPGLDGGSLLDRGVSVWLNDNTAGPSHDVHNVPYILAGSCAGFFKQGEMIEVDGGSGDNTHSRLLNTIGSAVGLRNAAGDYLDDFGDPSLPKGVLDDIMS